MSSFLTKFIAIDRLVRTHKLYFKGTGNREQGTEKCPNSFGDCYIFKNPLLDVEDFFTLIVENIIQNP